MPWNQCFSMYLLVNFALTQQLLSWAPCYSLFPIAVQTANYKSAMDRNPLMLNHFQANKTQALWPGIWDWLQWGLSSLCPLTYLCFGWTCQHFSVTRYNSTSVGVLFIFTLQNASDSLRPSSMYFSSREHFLVQSQGISFPNFLNSHNTV